LSPNIACVHGLRRGLGVDLPQAMSNGCRS
jgi:hypothetical protein